MEPEDHKYANGKLLGLINESGQVADYKINVQKSFAFLYTNNERSERDTQETIPFTITYLGINLPEQTKDLHSKNYKIFMKETDKDTNRWKDIQCQQIGRLNNIKPSILPKLMYRFNAIPTKIPVGFCRKSTTDSKINIEMQLFVIAKRTLKKKKVGGRMLPNFRTY